MLGNVAKLIAATALCTIGATAALAAGTKSHAIAIHATPKYGPDFAHFDYVDPNAPKGGELKLAAIGNAFDNLNPYVLKGITAAGIGGTFDTLFERSQDEPTAAYGLVAESIEVAEDGTWVKFKLRDIARFHDGTPIIAEDVVFTFNAIKTKGHPFYRAYYKDVINAEAEDRLVAKFTFSDGKNHELPAIVADLPVLSKAYWADKDFEKTTLEPPLGSGPYRVVDVDPGRSITYERVKDYWAANLPVNVGQNNFDRMHYDYYRDQTVALEAFKAGNYDFRSENNSKLWATGYDSPALKEGWIQKQLVAHSNPAGMQGFIFNTRRPFFSDPKVRKALAYAFDFEWTNKTLFYGQYTRSTSFFSNSELASSGKPTPAELEILEPFRGQIPDEVFTQEYVPPSTDGSGSNRNNLREAIKLLKEAGWVIKDKKLTDAKTGQQFAFEILLQQPAFERIVLPLQNNLKRLGIDMKVRTVDRAQYKKRTDDFDFDMVVGGFGITHSPGNEQRDFWHSENADRTGSRNTAGAKNPVIDAMVDLIVAAPDRETLVERTKAFDRVLLWNHFVIPNWHIDSFRIAYWDFLIRPKTTPKYGLGVMTWSIDRERQAAISKARQGG
ncbi:MAG: extracellular solute-binding protein [Pseudomonadota bacterium]